MYTCIYRERDTCVCTYIYIYIYAHTCVCIYIYIYREREIAPEGLQPLPHAAEIKRKKHINKNSKYIKKNTNNC